MGIMAYALGMGSAGFLSSTVVPTLGDLESWGKGFTVPGLRVPRLQECRVP